ncbi:hypothetical protein AFLA_003437 [Aspergillus flavus NRRL3357]|nr:hypothetical protein AFLA_003437 [Aspergillus flavus NRRL3357]
MCSNHAAIGCGARWGSRFPKVYELRNPPPIGCSSCLTDHMGKKRVPEEGRGREEEKDYLSQQLPARDGRSYCRWIETTWISIPTG